MYFDAIPCLPCRSPRYKNKQECFAVKHMVKKALSSGLLNFVIITPYEAQKQSIELCLKNSSDELPWADRVFTIDSYQGRLGP